MSQRQLRSKNGSANRRRKMANPFWRKLPSRSSSIKLNGFSSNFKLYRQCLFNALHGDVDFKFPVRRLHRQVTGAFRTAFAKRWHSFTARRSLCRDSQFRCSLMSRQRAVISVGCRKAAKGTSRSHPRPIPWAATPDKEATWDEP